MTAFMHIERLRTETLALDILDKESVYIKLSDKWN
jgi:hypothetical protein